jgi:hypothetical protein
MLQCLTTGSAADPQRPRRFWQGLRTGLLLGALLIGTAPFAQAQSPAQIQQVQPDRVQLDAGDQGETTIDLGASTGEAVSWSEVMGLWPTGVSPFAQRAGETGSSAAVHQSGDDNTASVTQNGAGHVAVLVQQGDGNTTTLQQNGSNHLAGIRLDGDDNTFGLTQNGSGHRYLLDFKGHDLGHSGPHEVVQNGTNNTAVQTGQGVTPFNIKQEGSGMTMVIRHRGPSQ